MATRSMFPLAAFEVIHDADADSRLIAWGHYLEGCDRPFGRQSFGLYVADELVAVCVSASTVSGTCGGWSRFEVVELARLCADPMHRWATRVALRFWREIAPRCWSERYWSVAAAVSYQNAVRHTGDIYRFDGWTKVAENPGSAGGGTWTKRQAREAKALWVYPLGELTSAERRAVAMAHITPKAVA